MFTDVAQLCNVHIPAWLATEGMDADKIASFYDDPVKQACDAWSMAKAVSFRKVTIENGLYWRAQRWARFLAWFGEGCLAADAKRDQRGIKPPRSLLVVILVIVIVFIVVVGLTGGVVRRVALVVPELAIDAVGREQLRMRAALDRLAA